LGAIGGTTPVVRLKPELEELPEVIFGGPPSPVDHGLTWCNEEGKYSIDGVRWFNVTWQQPSIVPYPDGFPLRDLPGFGTRDFVRVEDGWFLGADLFHYDGLLFHVSYTGERVDLSGRDIQIRGFFQQGSRVFAFGYMVLKDEEAGSLFELTKAADGSWTRTRVASLPSAPWSHARGPNNELLLSDGPNDYAVIGSTIVPLRCERTRQGSYFSQ